MLLLGSPTTGGGKTGKEKEKKKKNFDVFRKTIIAAAFFCFCVKYDCKQQSSITNGHFSFSFLFQSFDFCIAQMFCTWGQHRTCRSINLAVHMKKYIKKRKKKIIFIACLNFLLHYF